MIGALEVKLKNTIASVSWTPTPVAVNKQMDNNEQ